MLDGVILGLSPDGIKVQTKTGLVLATKLDELVKIENPRGGSSLIIGFKQDKLIVKGNPVSWLTNQNIFGSNNAWDLCIALFRDLREQKIMLFKREAWDNVLAGNYDIHQFAFNTYVDAGPNKFAMMDLIKSICGSLSSNADQESEMRWMMYPGPGMIVNNRSVNLTIYDKQEQMRIKYPGWRHELIPDLDVLENYLRVEATIKYSWFSKKKRRMSSWRGKDWDAEARTIIGDAITLFGLNYIMRCPNVFAPNFGDDWRSKDKRLLDDWRKGKKLSKPQVSLLRRMYEVDTSISLNGHRNILWLLARPDSVTRPVTVDIANTRTFPGTELLAPIHPMHSRFVVGASQKLLRRVDRACGLTKARD